MLKTRNNTSCLIVCGFALALTAVAFPPMGTSVVKGAALSNHGLSRGSVLIAGLDRSAGRGENYQALHHYL